MKTITERQLTSVKRVAMNVNPLVTNKNKCITKIQELTQEVEILDAEITGHEGGIIALTGYKSGDLVKKVVTKIDKYDKNGKQLTKTEYIPTDKLVFDEEKKVYNIVDSTDCEWENPVVEDVTESIVEESADNNMNDTL